MTAPLDEARLRESIERVRAFRGHMLGMLFMEGRTLDPLDLDTLLAALSAERERADRAVGDYLETLGEAEVQYEVWGEDEYHAGSDSLSEAQHYAAVYGQDHPVQIVVATTYRKPLATQSPSRTGEGS